MYYLSIKLLPFLLISVISRETGLKTIKDTIVAFYRPIGLSIVSLSISFLVNDSIDNNVVHLINGFLLITIWCYECHSLRVESRQYTPLDKQLDELKRLNLELQVLVDKELRLAKEDISQLHLIILQSHEILRANIAFGKGVDAKAAINKSLMSGSDYQAIIRVLQSEDITRQLAIHIMNHLEEINKAVDLFTDIYKGELSSKFDDNLQETQIKITEYRESLFDFHSQKTITSNSMKSGDIELF